MLTFLVLSSVFLDIVRGSYSIYNFDGDIERIIETAFTGMFVYCLTERAAVLLLSLCNHPT